MDGIETAIETNETIILKEYVRDGSASLNYPFAVPVDTSYSCSTPSYNNYTVFNDTNDASVFIFIGIQVGY